ncbi:MULTISPECIES: hypothetical protein [unclassified Psychrobacillus]|uniref:hypothetical protein n=1 Tax=unclassified Psychrobacillus TaxID=2636677 RepID=UPI0030FA1481
MNGKLIHILQADIIFKALHYVAKKENIEIPEELERTFEVLAEQNPNETYAEHTLEVMEYLNDFIISNEQYSEYFKVEEEEQ